MGQSRKKASQQCGSCLQQILLQGMRIQIAALYCGPLSHSGPSASLVPLPAIRAVSLVIPELNDKVWMTDSCLSGHSCDLSGKLYGQFTHQTGLC